ncbi:sodium-independent sulfate anion transporter-like [Microplitis mediator]|uniref:sodium-independent sulfate anion transporter-like n=1 Tax=Microplitis mediator TaxID=375433 RepID=UPI00255258C6|nr:sodium-independent sulfate anion transporter-like [Microplitis mediator]XP_057330222.1 sodium-independent sulfate anion transporter-like [Microplitis mediator]XP_057330223.1 sodium-independent sulfate anion transporter-like [Microplitis mediator]XP_057330224.1 sodium-independent sulfate anion transporter-like [Microplitis mediator]
MSKYELKDDRPEGNHDVQLTSFHETGDGLVIRNPIIDLNNRLNPSETVDKTTNHQVVYEYEDPSVGAKWFCQRLKKSFRKKNLFKRVPILEWLPKYQKDYIMCDLVAGVTVGLTIIPQAIAYANVAGISPQNGLYSSFMAPFLYTIFGSSKDVPVGPTALVAILTRETLSRAQVTLDHAVLLTFISGLVALLMGILQLGFLIDFISGPVSVGFTSAAAIIIATSQVKDILGIRISNGKFIDTWHSVFEHIGETRLWDAVMGTVCLIILFCLRKLKDIPIITKNTKVPSLTQKIATKFLWFVTTSRNILVVIVGGVMAWMLESHLGTSPVVLTGHVKGGMPSLQLPPFSAEIGNHTYTFFHLVSSLGSGCLVIPLLSILETIALAKVFSDGKAVDATQEMLALGVCNLVSSFFQSMPVSGGLSRGAVNHSSGVKTTFGGVYTGVLVLLSLQFLTPYLYYVPKCILAAVIIAAVIFMVEFHVVKPMWKSKKIDLIPAVVTFVCCLFVGLELGMIIGISVNLLFLLYASARPSLRVRKITIPGEFEYLMITPDRSLSFPSVEYVRAVISKYGTREGVQVPIVIDSTHIQAADFTAARGIKNIIEDFAKRGQPLIFYNLKSSIATIFQGVKPTNMIICSNENELNQSLRDLAAISSISIIH